MYSSGSIPFYEYRKQENVIVNNYNIVSDIPTICKNCGAPLKNNLCKYCGTEYKKNIDLNFSKDFQRII